MDHKIKLKKILDLKLYDKNTKKHPDSQIKKIKRSIKEYGFTNPVLIDEHDNVIAGHGRIIAAKELKLEEVPTISLSHLTRAQVRAYRIADNKLAESEWDFDFLKEELNFLKTESYDLSLTGFEDAELNFLHDSEEISEDVIEVGAYERAKKLTKIKLGDVFKLGGHILMCGDATKSEHVGILMQDEKAVLMVTDPPYGVKYDPQWRDDADKKGLLGNKYPTRATEQIKNDDIIDWSEAYKHFKGNACYIWHAGRHTSEVQQSIEKTGFEIISQIIWVKPHFVLSRGDYHWKHEPCWYAVRKGKNHNWQGSRKETTVWEIAGMNCMGSSKEEADEATGHSTQKPIKCMSTPILNNSKKQDIIYDCFGGSGSTLIACEQTQRQCRMMELDSVYCQIIIDRWEKLTNKKHTKLLQNA